jgi:hypothetical protein
MTIAAMMLPIMRPGYPPPGRSHRTRLAVVGRIRQSG